MQIDHCELCLCSAGGVRPDDFRFRAGYKIGDQCLSGCQPRIKIGAYFGRLAVICGIDRHTWTEEPDRGSSRSDQAQNKDHSLHYSPSGQLLRLQNDMTMKPDHRCRNGKSQTMQEYSMRTVLITGASRGIGAAMARQMTKRQDHVIACARDVTALGPEAAERRSLDVTDTAALELLASEMATRDLDLLICNAGVFEGRGGIEDATLTATAFENSFAVNVTGVFLTIRACLPALRRRKGKIAVISSQMGSTARGKGNSYAYRASKSAATNLAACLSHELAPDGIAVGAYHPGWVRTDMGGAGADISAEDSAAGLIARFDELAVNTSGKLRFFSGEDIPF
jgi:NAD(P)-dependent dehydrogenase (short-subunit alcohol dehydrogenase family)